MVTAHALGVGETQTATIAYELASTIGCSQATT